MSVGIWIFAAALLGDPGPPSATELAGPAVVVTSSTQARLRRLPPFVQLKTDSSDGSLQLELRSAFWMGVPSGFNSFTLRTDNKGKPRVISVEIAVKRQDDLFGTARLRRRVEVPVGAQSVELLMPVTWPPLRRELSVRLTGAGPIEDPDYVITAFNPDYVVASSVALAPSEKQRRRRAWVRIDPEALPTDWRAYLGIDLLLLTGAERDAISPRRWEALSTWVAQGGSLIVVRPGAPEERRPYGLGRFILSSRVDLDAGRKLDCDPSMELLDRFQAGAPAPKSPPRERARMDLCGARVAADYQQGSPAPLFVGFIGVFFSVVTPLVFALGWRRRARLLWGLPLASVLGAVALLCALTLREGLGGEGQRQLLRLLPGEGRELLIQEQASKTGQLFGRGGAQGVPDAAAFELIYSAAIKTPKEQFIAWGGLDPSRVDGAYTGRWWRSRSVLAHRITELVRTEQYLERDGDRVRSRLELPLGPLFLWEGARLYTLARLEPGGEGRLQPADVSALRALVEGSGPAIRRALVTAVERWPRGFIGQAPVGAGVIDSGEGIEWTDKPVIMLGSWRVPK